MPLRVATTFVFVTLCPGPLCPRLPAAPARDPLATAATIDREIDRRLTAAKVPASPACDDAEFIRRLSLDLRGRVPTAERTAAFLADTSAGKRRRLIDEFLADPAFGEHFAHTWYHRMVRPDMDNQGLLSPAFQTWLTERFNRNDGWDRTVRDILTAEGDRDHNPATVFWLANVEGAKQRDVAPNKVTAAASRLFLGTRLECCECHNHPFDGRFRQTDFWGVAAFFAGTHSENTAKKAAKQANNNPAIHEGAAPRKGKGREGPAPTGSVVVPDSNGRTVKARFLLGDTPTFAGRAKPRARFAAWLTAPQNPYFARAAVNKLWANFFGRGLVDPVDDIRPDSRNTHPELFRALADEYASSGFDSKHLIRCVCNSAAYQRTSRPLEENKADEQWYSHMRPKVMNADVLFDSLTVVLGHAPAGTGTGKGKGAGKKGGRRDAREQFRQFFHAEADDDAGVVEEYTHGIPQVLRLMNAEQLNDTTAVVATLRKAGPPEKVIEAMYLRVLSRQPTATETSRMSRYLAGETNPAKGYGDLLWVLLNSGEFLLNH